MKRVEEQEGIYVFAFNQFCVKEPEKTVNPLDSGFTKEYVKQWEQLRKIVEPILVGREAEGCMRVVIWFVDGKPRVKEVYSAKLNYHFGVTAQKIYNAILFGEE